MHDIIDNNQQKYNSTRLDVHKNTIQEIRNHIFRKLFSNKGNAKHGVSPLLNIWPGDLDLWFMTLKINRVPDSPMD